jgi:hypothetical protein
MVPVIIIKAISESEFTSRRDSRPRGDHPNGVEAEVVRVCRLLRQPDEFINMRQGKQQGSLLFRNVRIPA